MQNAIALIIVALAVAAMLRKICALARGKSSSCGHCSGAQSCQIPHARKGACGTEAKPIWMDPNQNKTPV